MPRIKGKGAVLALVAQGLRVPAYNKKCKKPRKADGKCRVVYVKPETLATGLASGKYLA